MINCEIELDLLFSEEYIIFEISITPRVVGNPDVNPPVPGVGTIQTTGETFPRNNAKFYVPCVTLSINDNIKFVENIKQGFKRTISWNKYKSEVTTQAKNNNLDYLIDPTVRNINRLFVVSLKNRTDDPTRDLFDAYYMPVAEINDFNTFIDNKPIFDQLVKNKQDAYEKMCRNLSKCQERMTIKQ